MDNARAFEIAEKNDTVRKLGFGIVLTKGVAALPDLEGLLAEVRHYNNFNKDNDPYHERDFGKLTWHGETIFWKIDYYDQALQYWEDPLSPKCKRILTIMLASEY